jgi:hypothetical protein
MHLHDVDYLAFLFRLRLILRAALIAYRVHCRVKLYLIKATALRAAAPTAHAPGMRPCRADPSRHTGPNESASLAKAGQSARYFAGQRTAALVAAPALQITC